MNRTFVATFDWHVGDKLGLATIAGRQMLMSHLVYNLNTKYVPSMIRRMHFCFLRPCIPAIACLFLPMVQDMSGEGYTLRIQPHMM
jgi:hypothetical protein